jgi:hypothetical protein
MKKPRGTCSQCERRVSVSKGGFAHDHKRFGDPQRDCWGSWQRVVELQELEERQAAELDLAISRLVLP